uniref:Uncharacterized protein n=1 Tax=Knipowitschia caucasica TaxID=637954 RepID=A0AAV2L4M1_KNICA
MGSSYSRGFCSIHPPEEEEEEEERREERREGGTIQLIHRRSEKEKKKKSRERGERTGETRFLDHTIPQCEEGRSKPRLSWALWNGTESSLKPTCGAAEVLIW